MATIDTYLSTRDRLIGEVSALSPADLGAPVALLRGWTVRDVVAHLTGLVVEITGGVEPPWGSDEATARQVGDRAASSIEDLVEEWVSACPGLGAAFDTNPRLAAGLTGDLAIHVHDLAETVEAISPPPSDADSVACGGYAPLLQQRVAERLGIGLTLELEPAGTWAATDESLTAMTLVADPVRFIRAVTGRRTRSFVEAFDWSSDPTAIIDEAWVQYGALQPE